MAFFHGVLNEDGLSKTSTLDGASSALSADPRDAKVARIPLHAAIANARSRLKKGVRTGDLEGSGGLDQSTSAQVADVAR